MSRVLRMASGDNFILLDGKGGRFLAEIVSISKEAVAVQIKTHLPASNESHLEITLCQAVTKSASMDYLIQKTSELGVTRIFPVTTSRTVVHLKGDKQQKKLNRWKEIARNAAKQCNRDIPAEILPPTSFEKLLQATSNVKGVKAILWEGEKSQGLKGLLRSLEPANHFTALVGPEGGFSREEVAYAQKKNFVPVSLGNRILRAETAALFIVAIVQYEWGDMNIWEELGF